MSTLDNINREHFKKVTLENAHLAFEWFERQRLPNEWNLSVNDQLALLGNIGFNTHQSWLAPSTSERMMNVPDEVLLRLGILMGVEKSLQLLVPHNRNDLIGAWFNTPNDNPLFQGSSIKHYLISHHDLKSFYNVEAYLIETVMRFLSGV